MSNFEKCIHGGAEECTKYGGSGSPVHASGYVHPVAHVSERLLAKSVDPAERRRQGAVYVDGLEGDFDDDIAKSFMNISLPIDLSKALYHFDLTTQDGVDRLLELLPILSDDILQSVYTEIWPDYDVEGSILYSPRVARLEIKGYLLGHGSVEGADEQD